MKRLITLVACVLIFSLLVTGLTIVLANSRYHYPLPSGERVVIDNGTAKPEWFVERREKIKEAEQQGRFPKVATDQNEYDFGVMNPLTMGRHTFTIRNEGSGPLQLRKGGTTCKCTLSEVSDGLIAPGEEGQVTLEWNTGRHATYSHSATILTNDPDNARLKFRVHGTVLATIESTKESFYFAKLEPDQSATSETVVYSQIYGDLPLRDVTCSLEGALWDIEPADAATLKKLDATAGYRIRLTTPPLLPSGRFQGVVTLNFEIPEQDGVVGDEASDQSQPDGEVSEAEGGDVHTLQLLVAGNVLRRISVYGDGVGEDGVVYFDVVDQGQGRKLRLLMKTRDKDRELLVKRVDVRPEFVQVTITPFGGDLDRGLYYLDLEVPPDAPACRHNNEKNQGELRIEFDHPRIEELVLKLRLSVAPGGI